MSMKTVAGTGLKQAYSTGSWEYTDYDAAYAGCAGGNLYLPYILRFEIPAFEGVSEALEVALVCNSGVGETVQLRYALCSSDTNKEKYLNTSGAVSDDNQIATGVAVFSGMSTDVVTRSFQVPTTKLKAGTWYLILWAYNETGLSIRAVKSDWGSHSVALGYNIGIARIRTASGVKQNAVYAKTLSGIKQMTPYIQTAAGIKPGG